jgi:sigma-B regulation protein RsbU (phosphoserine phosphatase)
VVAELNRRFCAGDNDGRFLTMVLCVLDTHTGALRCARAGHPLPVIVRGGACSTIPDEGGPPLGVIDIAEFEDVEVSLEPGDRVCLCSDGVVEQTKAGSSEQFGEARMHEKFAAGAGDSGEGVVERTVAALSSWAGGRTFIDDVSLVVIDWAGRGV